MPRNAIVPLGQATAAVLDAEHATLEMSGSA